MHTYGELRIPIGTSAERNKSAPAVLWLTPSAIARPRQIHSRSVSRCLCVPVNPPSITFHRRHRCPVAAARLVPLLAAFWFRSAPPLAQIAVTLTAPNSRPRSLSPHSLECAPSQLLSTACATPCAPSSLPVSVPRRLPDPASAPPSLTEHPQPHPRTSSHRRSLISCTPQREHVFRRENAVLGGRRARSSPARSADGEP
jgi:hypothetical protein